MNISEIGELYQIPKVGFSENEIIRAEQNIGVTLPSNYRNYLIQYGLAKINYAYNYLVKPENIKTTYQLIQQDIQKNWENEFLKAKNIGTIYLMTANLSQAKTHFKKAFKIYEKIWADEPEMIEAKYREIQELYPQIGFSIGKTLSGLLT